MGNCPTCSNEESIKNLDPRCYEKRMWTRLIFSSVFVFIIGLILILIYLLIIKLFKRRQKRVLTTNEYIEPIEEEFDENENDRNWLIEMKEWQNNIIYGKTIFGKIFMVVILFCTILSVILYSLDTKYDVYIEACKSLNESLTMKIDLGLNLIFIIYLIFRINVAQDKLGCWFSLYTLVDLLTIPPSIFSFYLNRSWTGFRFLRIILIMTISDILQYIGLIRQAKPIRIIEIVSKFVAIWFSVTGLVHLAENSGDFFCNYCNAQQIDIFNSIYFMIITMTTVGYGDISCKTYIGKFFVLLSLLSGLAFFTTMIPEFSNLFRRKSRYLEKYIPMKGKRHVIICGHITYHSLAPFLRDFLHKGRDEVDELDVIIIDTKSPDTEMESLLKRYDNKLQYFIGTLMNVQDLQRIQADKASSCLIIANKECSDPLSDDSSNIMRVISLKNFNCRLRILLQLLRYQNKLNVISIPGWNNNNDEIICISELKLGLIAMSSIVPGFATMMTNIFRMSSYKTKKSQEMKQVWVWHDLYHRGAGMELYLEQLPPSFLGKSFSQCALICFKLGAMLLAIENERKDEYGNLALFVDVAPCDNSLIDKDSKAFLVCLSSQDAMRVKHYCSICYPELDHLTENDFKRMKKCHHIKEYERKKNERKSISCQLNQSEAKQHSILCVNDTDLNEHLLSTDIEPTTSPCWTSNKRFFEEDPSIFDSTGMFYYTSHRNLEDAILNIDFLIEYHRQSNKEDFLEGRRRRSLKHPLQFKDHIIVCLHADESSPIIGLRNFVMPLRASSLKRNELSTIIFLTHLSYFEKEWKIISTFPEIYILNESPNNPYNLELLSINSCRQCVIMSTLDRTNLDNYLVDKSSILCTLNIRQIQMKQAGLFSQFSLTGKSKSNKSLDQTKFLSQKRIQTLTALTIDSNVQYVEQGHTDEADRQFFLTTPFASGAAFADIVLDCILSCAYYNRNAVNLLRNLLVGGIDIQLEEILAQGKQFEQCQKVELLRKRNRPRISLVQINSLIQDFNNRSKTLTFGELFIQSVQSHGIIVMGIYRLLDLLIENDPKFKGNRSIDQSKRIVIYYPPNNYNIHSTDMIYIIEHSHIDNQEFDLNPSKIS